MQKTSLFFVKNNYRKKKISNLDEFYVFVKSKKGITKRKNLENYYNKTQVLKEYKKQKKWIKFILNGVWLFIYSPEGRSVVQNYLREKILLARFEDNC